MLEEVHGALDGPPTADQIAGISPKDKKKAKEAASTQEQGSEEENDEEVAEKSVKTILTDDEAARLTDSFLRGDMDIELSEEHKRAMVDGRVSPDNLDPQYEASMEGPGAANISLAQEYDDEFHTFSYKQLQFIAGSQSSQWRARAKPSTLQCRREWLMSTLTLTLSKNESLHEAWSQHTRFGRSALAIFQLSSQMRSLLATTTRSSRVEIEALKPETKTKPRKRSSDSTTTTTFLKNHGPSFYETSVSGKLGCRQQKTSNFGLCVSQMVVLCYQGT